MDLYTSFLMSKIMLSLGCMMIAFSPFLAMFFLVMYKKSQLVIIVTTSAFFFLLSTLVASLIWFLFALVGLGDIFVSILIPGIFSSFFFRCLFVSLYHKVERVIHVSIEKEAANHPPKNNNTTENNNDDTITENDDDNGMQDVLGNIKLQMNDASCGLAAGVGFGGMHTILFYGTLLASESKNDNIVYEASCPNMPGLVQSAIFAFAFAILDIFWMLLTFFGMRRRLMYHRGDMYQGGVDPLTGAQFDFAANNQNRRRSFGSYFGNSRAGGNMALLTVLLTHLFASTITVISNFNYGCHITMPCLLVLLIFTIYFFWSGCSKIYMPPENTSISITRTASRMSPSATPRGGGGGANNSRSGVGGGGGGNNSYDGTGTDGGSLISEFDDTATNDDSNSQNVNHPGINYRSSNTSHNRYNPSTTTAASSSVNSSFKIPRRLNNNNSSSTTPTNNSMSAGPAITPTSTNTPTINNTKQKYKNRNNNSKHINSSAGSMSHADRYGVPKVNSNKRVPNKYLVEM